MEGKVEHKFDMTPHTRNMEEYRKMCRERTNKSMIKNRQIQANLLSFDCFSDKSTLSFSALIKSTAKSGH